MAYYLSRTCCALVRSILRNFNVTFFLAEKIIFVQCFFNQLGTSTEKIAHISFNMGRICTYLCIFFIPEHLRPSFSFEITSCSALSLSLYHKFVSELENYKEKMEQINVDDEQPTSIDTKTHPCIVVGVKKTVGA